jgi:sugar lactone lactonase YvrE
MPILGSFASGAISTVGLAQQAMLAFLKASTAISGSSFVLQQTVSGPDGAIIGGRNSSIYGQSSFAAYGDYLVTGDGDYNQAHIWNLSDGSFHMTVPAPSPPAQTNGFGWQIDIHGDYFIAGNGSGYATIHNVSTGALITTITGAARNVAIDENYAVGCGLGGFDPGSGAGPIKIFELATSTLTTFPDPNYDSAAYFGGGVGTMDISGNNLILASNNGSIITVHDIPTALSNGNLNTTSLTINATVSFTSLTAEGNYLALGWTNDVDKIFVYDLTTGTLLHTLAAPIGAAATFGATVNIKDNYLVAGNLGWDFGPAAVYDLTTGTLLQTFTETDATDISTWLNPGIGGAFGSAVAITDSKTIIGSRNGSEDSTNNTGAFLIYSNPGQEVQESTGTADWSNATLKYTLDNPNAYGTSQDDYFANVAISSTHAIIGAQNEAVGAEGKAYIFDLSDGSLAHTIDNPNQGTHSEPGDLFGIAVGISDTHAIVSAYSEDDSNGFNSGIAYIFNVSDGSLAHTINNPNAYGTATSNGYSNDMFGNSVAISGDYAIVGAMYEDDDNGVGSAFSGNDSGKAYIFNVSDGSLLHTLDNPDAYGDGVQDYFGTAVSISGDYAIVSARLEDDSGGNGSGKAYIFNVTSGSLVYTLDNPNGYGTSEFDYFGGSVAISDTHAIVGAYGEDDAGGTTSGKAYIFDLSDGSLAYTLDNPNPYGTSQDDHFGVSVSISDTHAIVGAIGEDDADGNTSGKVYIYDLSDGSLTNTLDNPNAYGTSQEDRFGDRVSISGSNIIVGAMFEDDAGGTNSGKSYIFSAPIIEASAPAEESTGWTIDLSNVTYDNVSFGIGNIDGTPYQITFNADGTKMYQLGANTKRVIQYTLSTAFDLSTAPTLSRTFDINASGQETSPSALFFSTDGTKMYICGFANATVYQYSLSVAFDISTAIYANQAYDISIQESYPTGIVFNPDGTKMYVCGFGDNIHEYGLTTAFDVSSASFNNVSFSVTNQATQGWGFRFNADGTKMYVVSSRTDTVYQYSLATAFDLSSTSYDNVSISVNSQDNDPLDIAFNTDGTKMYVSGSQTDTIYQYSTGL